MPKKTKNKEKSFSESSVKVLLEDIRGEIKLVAEGQAGLRQEMNKKFDGLQKEMNEGFADMRSSFKSIFEYLSRVEDELVEIEVELRNFKKVKVDYGSLEKRIAAIEQKLESYKTMIMKKKIA